MKHRPATGRDPIALEAYLALLYTDARARELFLANPRAAARAQGVSENDAEALCDIDKTGLHMAAASYAHKRDQHRKAGKSLYQAMRAWVAKL